jgi:hypothetical protein
MAVIEPRHLIRSPAAPRIGLLRNEDPPTSREQSMSASARTLTALSTQDRELARRALAARRLAEAWSRQPLSPTLHKQVMDYLLERAPEDVAAASEWARSGGAGLRLRIAARELRRPTMPKLLRLSGRGTRRRTGASR